MSGKRRKPRAEKRRIAGRYPIDTGFADIIADPDRDGGYVLEVNRVPSSYVVPGAPEVLAFEYMGWLAGFVDKQGPFTAVHLGAAGCALPSYFAHQRRQRRIHLYGHVAVAKAVREVFDPPVEIAVAEARACLLYTSPSPRDS